MDNANEELERLARLFQQDTGLLAPFKDEPVSVANDPHYDLTCRQHEWDKWFQARRKGGNSNMGTPEDVAAEKHFTPPTLTAMLTRALNQGYELRFESEAEAHNRYLNTIKLTFKEWLKTVGLPPMSEEATRQLLITLVDEP